MGKLGSIAVQLVLDRKEFDRDPGHLGVALGIFAILMAMGAVFAWVWLPDIQLEPIGDARELAWPILPSKTLEVLAKGTAYAILPPPMVKDR